MKPVTWIHTADLHLDQPVKGLHGCANRLSARKEDYRETFSRIVSVAKQKKVDFFFIAGDFLEHGYVQPSTVQWVKTCLKGLHPTRVMISPGNHDPFRNDSYYYMREDWPENVHIFSPQWETIYYNEYNLVICGRGFSDYIEPKWISPPESVLAERQILITHGTVTDHKSESCNYFPMPSEELAKFSFDYVALGHNHKSSSSVLDNCKQTIICYPGSPEALSFKETGERFIVYGEINDKGTHLEWIQIHTRAYERIICDVSHCASREDIVSVVQQELRNYSKLSCFMFVLTGRYLPGIDLQAGLFWLKEKIKDFGVFYFTLVNEAKPDFDLAYYRKQQGIIGCFIQKMEERLQQNPKDQDLIEDALYKGLELLTESDHR